MTSFHENLAEGQGFEPWWLLITTQLLSKQCQ